MINFTITSKICTITGIDYIILVNDGKDDLLRNIQTFPGSSMSQSKHQLHSISQMVLFQLQDNEITPLFIENDFTITGSEADCLVNKGLCIYKTQSGEIGIISHQGLMVKKLVEAAHRYCTRWVRLDI